MADDRINMTADEFIDHWTEWAPTVTAAEADVLQTMLVDILASFEERGSVTHGRAVCGATLGTHLYESPDTRKNG